jgi:hypothetical protein
MTSSRTGSKREERAVHCFVALAWQGPSGERLLVTVNYAPNQSQCYVRLPFADLGTGQWRLQDLIGEVACDREGYDLQTDGLYQNVSPWKASVFSLMKYDATAP